MNVATHRERTGMRMEETVSIRSANSVKDEWNRARLYPLFDTQASRRRLRKCLCWTIKSGNRKNNTHDMFGSEADAKLLAVAFLSQLSPSSILKSWLNRLH
jgi:hypothetical protein